MTAPPNESECEACVQRHSCEECDEYNHSLEREPHAKELHALLSAALKREEELRAENKRLRTAFDHGIWGCKECGHPHRLDELFPENEEARRALSASEGGGTK